MTQSDTKLRYRDYSEGAAMQVVTELFSRRTRDTATAEEDQTQQVEPRGDMV